MGGRGGGSSRTFAHLLKSGRKVDRIQLVATLETLSPDRCDALVDGPHAIAVYRPKVEHAGLIDRPVVLARTVLRAPGVTITKARLPRGARSFDAAGHEGQQQQPEKLHVCALPRARTCGHNFQPEFCFITKFVGLL